MEPQDWFEGTFDSDYLAIYESTLDPMRSEREAWEIVRALELKAGAAVLDCPCGYGRHALVLARAGFHVAGVDLSPAFLEIARERALKDDLKAEFHQADMRALPSEFEARFDGAFSAFTSFGFFDKDEENAKALAELARCVRPGSRVLVEMRNHLQLLEDLRTRTWFRGRSNR
jgi:SAM-dependent methyltransferase